MCRILKKTGVFLLAGLFLTGCTASMPPETSVSTIVTAPREEPRAQTEATYILERIWAQYEPSQRFSIYGGMMEQPVADAPGELDMENPASWMSKYRVPVAHQNKLDKGAGFSHLMNERLLTVAVFHVTSRKELPTLVADWRRELQQGQWILPSPERMLLAKAEGDYLLMAYGSVAHIKTLKEKLRTACPEADVFYEEPITV